MSRGLRLKATGLLLLVGGLVVSWGPGEVAGKNQDEELRPASGRLLAWARFDDGPETYQGTPYWWLGRYRLTFRIEVEPGAGHELQMLWGSKNDQRHASITINGKRGKLRHGGYDGFGWVRVKLPPKLEGEAYEVKMKGSGGQEAFLAAIRLVGRSERSGKATAIDSMSHRVRIETTAGQGGSKSGGQYAASHPAILRIWRGEGAQEPTWPSLQRVDASSSKPLFKWVERSDAQAAPSFKLAEVSASIAGYSLDRVDRWLDEKALDFIDEDTGLYRVRNKWDYADTAADCYPFLTWAAWVTDHDIVDGPVRRVLKAEQELCNVKGALPAPYNFQENRPEQPGYDQLMFGASEYVKDGLIPIVEVTGKDAWYKRMKQIEEEIWERARVSTAHGRIPSKDVEVNGEQLQVLPRLYRMSGEERFLRWAKRIADYYLSREDYVPQRLDDHGDEIIGGLGLLLGVLSEVEPETAETYRADINYLLDQIIERGTNNDGLFYNTIEGGGRLSDNWGYNYVAHLCFDMAVGKPVYHDQVRRVLHNLGKPKYSDYPWEGGDHPDGYGDSIEGGMYVVNRLPVKEGLEWVDRETMKSLVPPAPNTLGDADLWGVMKLHANGVRTVIMHALMHTRGCRALPWQQGLELGASQEGDSLAIVLRTEEDWSGRLVFDETRHRRHIGLQQNWPRINTLPEWFTVNPDQTYEVRQLGTGKSVTSSGEELHAGKEVELAAGEELRLIVNPQP